MDVDTFFSRTKRFLIDLLTRETRNRTVCSQATTWIRFVKDGIKWVELVFNSRMLAVYNLSDMDEIVSEMIKHMQQQIENPALRDSKFVFDGVIGMNIDFHRLNLTGRLSYLPLPDWLAKKGAIINPKNSDMECFKWTVIAAMKWREIGDHNERISKLRRYEDDFDWDRIKFPGSFRDIKRFESRNEITINILAFERKKVYICRKGKEYDRVANLMLITDQNDKQYVAIKSLRRLLSRQNSKHKESQHFCINCLQGFREKKSRDEHLVYCRNNEAIRIEMPNSKPIVQYSDGQYLYIIRCLLLKYRLIFFTSLDSIWRAFRRVKYRKTSKNISQYFIRRYLIIYLLSNSKNFTPGVKILEFKSNRRHQDFAKSKIYTNHSNQNILEGGNFWG